MSTSPKSSSIPKTYIENYIGMVQIPVGLMGPIDIQGKYAKGKFFVPMATTEGALVASYTRGARVISAAGGVHVSCLSDQMSRIPGFVLKNLSDARILADWCQSNIESLRKVASSTSGYIDLINVRCHVEGHYMFLDLSFTTAEAAGQNMVTFGADAVCRFIEKTTPVKIKKWYIESNLSSDKKPSFYNQINGRGKRVTAEITIPRQIVRKLLHCKPEDIFNYSQMAHIASMRSGAMGSQGHFSNAIAAIFIACGQDVACVAESSSGYSTSAVTDDEDLYVSVTLPNLVVGTVGGGTALPNQREYLDSMGCSGTNSARKLAEICAAVVLAGEISIASAIVADHFTRAHLKYGRRKRKLNHKNSEILYKVEQVAVNT